MTMMVMIKKRGGDGTTSLFLNLLFQNESGSPIHSVSQSHSFADYQRPSTH